MSARCSISASAIDLIDPIVNGRGSVGDRRFDLAGARGQSCPGQQVRAWRRRNAAESDAEP